MTPTLYLTIEEAARELDAKILIGGAAVREGLSVVIGQQWLLANNHAFIPKGLLLFKGMDTRLVNAIRIARESGHLTAALDEEVMGVADVPYMQRHIDSEIAEYCDIYLAQGELHAGAVADKVGVSKDVIRIVGNPRVDLLRSPFSGLFGKEAEDLRLEHGDYVLLNTNAGWANSAHGSVEKLREVVIRVGWLKPGDPDGEALFRASVDFDVINLALIRDFLAKMKANLPDTRVIIRPHGAERAESWEKLATHFPNVRVIRDGRHVSWMLGARAVVHTCCTTGLEAEILGKAAINLRPSDDDEGSLHHVFISNIANFSVNNDDDAVGALTQILSGNTSLIDRGRKARMAALGEHITGLEGSFSYEKIAATAAHFLAAKGAKVGGFRWQPTDAENYLGAVRRTDYQREKIDLSQPEFETKWRELTSLAGISTQVNIRQIGDSLFLVETA
jgi:surface carbohydrate biosynthesis protein